MRAELIATKFTYLAQGTLLYLLGVGTNRHHVHVRFRRGPNALLTRGLYDFMVSSSVA